MQINWAAVGRCLAAGAVVALDFLLTGCGGGGGAGGSGGSVSGQTGTVMLTLPVPSVQAQTGRVSAAVTTLSGT
jgi:hypothetical protein